MTIKSTIEGSLEKFKEDSALYIKGRISPMEFDKRFLQSQLDLLDAVAEELNELYGDGSDRALVILETYDSGVEQRPALPELINNLKNNPIKIMDYKVELKPSFWVVTLQHGCYSDWDIEYLFFRGNDENEIWDFLCRYKDDTYNNTSYALRGLMFEGRRHIIREQNLTADEIEDFNWGTEYGDSYEVSIKRMRVIEFKK